MIRVIVAVLLSASPGFAADDEIVMLPPLVIEESIQPPWRYGVTPRYQVLSSCSDRLTDELVGAITEATEAVHALVPPRFLPTPSGRDTLILLDENHWPAHLRDTVSTVLQQARPWGSAGASVPPIPPMEPPNRTRDEPGGSKVLPGASLVWNGAGLVRRAEFYQHLRLMDDDATTMFVIVSPNNLVGLDNWRMTPGALRELLERRVPRLPPWFTGGLLDVYRQAQLRGGRWIVPSMTWLSPEETQAVRVAPETAVALMPFDEFFNHPGGLGNEGPARMRVRLAQRELFLRWALDPDHESRQRAFWEFLDRACTEPVTETLFQGCFGADFAGIAAELQQFLPKAIRRSAQWRILPGDPMSARPEDPWRPATRVEIARVKGEWERMETTYVRAHLPDLTSYYYTQARRTLERGLETTRDVELLAALALLESEEGRTNEAREHLESATRLGVLRPRAQVLLARLRYEELRGIQVAPDHHYGADEVQHILAPLVKALQEPPATTEAYALLADVRSRLRVAPTAEELNALRDGALSYSSDAGLAVAVAELLIAQKQFADAERVLAVSLASVAHQRLRERLLQLRAKLPGANG